MKKIIALLASILFIAYSTAAFAEEYNPEQSIQSKSDAWEDLNLEGHISSIVSLRGDRYASIESSTTERFPIGIYKLTGQNWVQAGLSGKSVIKLVSVNDNLYAQDSNRAVYQLTDSGWNNIWSPTEPSTNNLIGIFAMNGALYLHDFTSGLHKWTGSSWTNLGHIIKSNENIWKISEVNNEFFRTNYLTLDSEGLYQSTATGWKNILNTDKTIYSMVPLQDDLYASIGAYGVSRKVDSGWEYIGLKSHCLFLAPMNGELYAGDSCQKIGVVKFNKSSVRWEYSGLAGQTIQHLFSVDNSLYAIQLDRLYKLSPANRK